MTDQTNRGYRGNFTFLVNWIFPKREPEIEQLQEWLHENGIRFEVQRWGEDDLLFSFMSDDFARQAKAYFEKIAAEI